MSKCGELDRASLYAHGLLDDAERNTFEQHLNGCSSCAAEVRESRELAVGLARTIPASAPPSGLRERVLKEAVLPRGVVAIRGELSSLVRMLPGAHYPSHHHASLEHCYVIEGDLVFEDHTLRAGDYSAGTPDKDHTAATTENGCLLFIVHNTQDRLNAY